VVASLGHSVANPNEETFYRFLQHVLGFSYAPHFDDLRKAEGPAYFVPDATTSPDGASHHFKLNFYSSRGSHKLSPDIILKLNGNERLVPLELKYTYELPPLKRGLPAARRQKYQFLLALMNSIPLVHGKTKNEVYRELSRYIENGNGKKNPPAYVPQLAERYRVLYPADGTPQQFLDDVYGLSRLFGESRFHIWSYKPFVLSWQGEVPSPKLGVQTRVLLGVSRQFLNYTRARSAGKRPRLPFSAKGAEMFGNWLIADNAVDRDKFQHDPAVVANFSDALDVLKEVRARRMK